MFEKVYDSVIQKVKQVQQKLAQAMRAKKTKGKKKDSASVLRNNEVVKPTTPPTTSLLEPTRFDITLQEAKSIRRSKDYVHIPPRDTYASNGGDL